MANSGYDDFFIYCSSFLAGTPMFIISFAAKSLGSGEHRWDEQNISSVVSCFFQDKKPEEADNLVYTVLRQRHIKEAIDQEEQLARERAARLAETRADIAAQRANDREIVQNHHDQVCNFSTC